MFYVVDLKQALLLEPAAYGADIDRTLRDRLVAAVEGSCTSDCGYVVSVLAVLDVGEGLIQHSGRTVFDVAYRALTLRVAKGDVVDAVVSETNKMGVFATVGPLTIFVSNYQIPSSFSALARNSHLRLRILGTKVEAARIFAIGTLNEDFLGVIF